MEKTNEYVAAKERCAYFLLEMIKKYGGEILEEENNEENEENIERA